MTVVRAALWAGKCSPVCRPPSVPGYVPLEVQGAWLAEELALAMGVPPAEVQRRLARGCRAFAMWSWAGDCMASWVWVSAGREWAGPLRRELHFQPDECHGWGAHTVPRSRGLGLLPALLHYAGRAMAGAGAQVMWNGITDENQASQRAHAAAGMRPVLHLVAQHEPAPTRLMSWACDYADPRWVARARLIVA